MHTFIPPVGLTEIQGDTRYQKTLGVVNIKNAGAIGGDAGDDTAAIQAVLDTAMEVYVPKDTFRTTSQLTFKLSGQKIYGPGTIKQMTAAANGFGYNSGVTAIKIKGLTITGSCTTSTVNVRAIQLPADSLAEECTFQGWNINATLEDARAKFINNHVINSIGDGVASAGGQGYGVHVSAPDCQVLNNSILGIKRNAVYCSGAVTAGGAQNCLVEGNVLEHNASVLTPVHVNVYTALGQSPLQNVKIRNNTIRLINMSAGLGAGVGVYGDSYNILVEGNSFSGIDDTAISITANSDGRPQRVFFKNNTIDQTAGTIARLAAVGVSGPLDCQVIGNNSNLTSASSLISDAGVNTRIRDNKGQPFITSNGTFRAYQSVSQADILDNTFTKLTFTTELYDTHGEYNNSTSVFQPTRKGYYLIGASVAVTPAVDAKPIILTIYKSGARDSDIVRFATSGTATIGGAGSAIVSANGTTDTFEIYFYHNFATTGSANPDTIASSLSTYFWAQYLGN